MLDSDDDDDDEEQVEETPGAEQEDMGKVDVWGFTMVNEGCGALPHVCDCSFESAFEIEVVVVEVGASSLTPTLGSF